MNFIQNRVFPLFAVALISLAIVGCGPATTASPEAQPDAQLSEASDSQEETETQQAAGDPIRIGALFPLSAPGSVVGGEAMRDTMIIAAEEINARGGLLGRPVELVVVDRQGGRSRQ